MDRGKKRREGGRQGKKGRTRKEYDGRGKRREQNMWEEVDEGRGKGEKKKSVRRRELRIRVWRREERGCSIVD